MKQANRNGKYVNRRRLPLPSCEVYFLSGIGHVFRADPALEDSVRRTMKSYTPGGGESMRVYISETGLRLIISYDKSKNFGDILHVSASFADRLPTWEELKAIKDVFFGDVDAMQMLPKKEDYVNVNMYTLHIYECPQEWGIG